MVSYKNDTRPLVPQRVRDRLSPHVMLLAGLAIFVVFLALRIPVRADFLINWDAVNYALGTELFSLEHHQPHPPGYIGYVALGWVLNHLTEDANSSLTLLSALSGAAAPAALFLLASNFMRRRYAAVTAVTFGLSPLVWYYSEVALGYSLAMALALFYTWAGYRAWKKVSVPHLFWATIFLVFLGSVRQSGGLFLIPLWLFLIWPFPWRRRLQAAAILVVGNLIWLVPLILLAGDVHAYFQAAAELANLAVAPTSLFSFDVFGLLRNFSFVAAGILVGINVGLLIIVLARCTGCRPLSSLTGGDRIFFFLWLVPSLATYVLIHTGQLGYILMILPIGFIWTGMSLNAMARQVHEVHLLAAAKRQAALVCRKPVLWALTILFALTNVLGYLYIPNATHALTRPENLNAELFDTLPNLEAFSETEREKIKNWARQFNVKRNDEYWSGLIRLIERFDPETTAVIAEPTGSGSFRHLTYYLPKYRIYGVGKDIKKDFGYLFKAHNGSSDYTVQGLEKVNRFLRLPQGLNRVIIPDKEIYSGLDKDQVEGGFKTLKDGTEVFALEIPEQALLLFSGDEDSGQRISVVHAFEKPGAQLELGEDIKESP
ncbi:MAG: hypothetical protein ACQES5_08195 [Thermodesulfobacteriota bacterium]